jgi:hypothetical protein
MTPAIAPAPSAAFRPLKFWLAIALVALITCGSALLAGNYNDRWGRPEALLEAAARVDRIPAQIGSWELQAAKPLPDESVEMLQCAGHTSRTYRHRETGQIINMFVIVGPPGPTAAHTPEICYSSRDYSIVSRTEKAVLPTPTHPDSSVWELTMRGNDVRADVLHVAYAWNAGDGWQASDSPRYGFSGKPYLYKLQVAGILDSSKQGQSEPCRAFLSELLPVLDDILLSSTDNSSK